MRNEFVQLFDVKNKIGLFGFILTLKLFLFCFFIFFFTPPQNTFEGFWGNFSPDTFTYIEPVEEFLRSFDLRHLFPYRMFGYSLPYLIIKIFFDQATSLNILILFQTILSAFSVYCLTRMSFQIFKNRASFFLVLAIYFSIIVVSFYDIYVLTESLTVSSLLISLYYLFKGDSHKNYLISGFFLAWAIFLKPIFFPVVLLFFSYIFIKFLNRPKIKFAKVVFFFLLPLLIFESIWVSGNLKYNNIFTLTSPTVFLPGYLDPEKHTMSLINFSKAIGDEWEYSWFYSDSEIYPFSSAVETSKFDKNSLIELKKEIKKAQFDLGTLNANTPKEEILRLNERLNNKLKIYTDSVKYEKPFQFYVVSSVIPFLRTAGSSSTHRMFGNYPTTNKKLIPLRIALDIIVWIVEILFLLSLFFMLFQQKKNFKLMFITLIILYIYLIHTLVFKSSDFRYIVPVLPLMILVIQIVLLRMPYFQKLEQK